MGNGRDKRGMVRGGGKGRYSGKEERKEGRVMEGRERGWGRGGEEGIE